jgi:tripartite ATP-independent transporter DctM subunit
MLDLLPILMFLTLMIVLFSGYPVAFVLFAVALVFACIGIGFDLFPPSNLMMIPLRTFGQFADNLIFPAIPPLICMGVAIARSGLAADFFDSLSHVLRKVPAGLQLSVLLIGIILAPSAGLIGASVSVLAVAAMPTMLAYNIPSATSAASVAASGTLGVILPPAIMLFFLADLLEIPIIGIFTSILLPAALLFLGYVGYFMGVEIHSRGRQQQRPPDGRETEVPSVGKLIGASVPTVLLIGLVVAAIISGWATPSQSGAVGAVGAFVLVALLGRLSLSEAYEILLETARITAMVFMVIIGANMFSFVFRLLGGDTIILPMLSALGLERWGKLTFILGVIFVLGFFIDWLEIVLITLPVFQPVITNLDFVGYVGDAKLMRVWIATAIAIVLQTSFLTPPFGFALFFLKASSPPEVKLIDIYRGAVPLVVIQLLVLALVLAAPWLAVVLPRLLIN